MAWCGRRVGATGFELPCTRCLRGWSLLRSDRPGMRALLRSRSDDTDALSSVVQRDTAIHPSIATKVASRFEFRTLLNQRTSCSHNRAGLPAQRTQLRMDWSLLDQMARRRRGDHSPGSRCPQRNRIPPGAAGLPGDRGLFEHPGRVAARRSFTLTSMTAPSRSLIATRFERGFRRRPIRHPLALRPPSDGSRFLRHIGHHAEGTRPWHDRRIEATFGFRQDKTDPAIGEKAVELDHTEASSTRFGCVGRSDAWH